MPAAIRGSTSRVPPRERARTRSNARAQWQRTQVGGQVPSLGIAADSAAEHGSGRARSTKPPALRDSRPTSSAEKRRLTATPTLYHRNEAAYGKGITDRRPAAEQFGPVEACPGTIDAHNWSGMQGQGLLAVLTVVLSLIYQNARVGEALPQSPTEQTPVIVAFGDSLTSGPGLEPGQTYPALLQRKIEAKGYKFRVVNAGVSGDTSTRALERLDNALVPEARILILALGMNDGLRGVTCHDGRTKPHDGHRTCAVPKDRGAAMRDGGTTCRWVPLHCGIPPYVHAPGQPL